MFVKVTFYISENQLTLKGSAHPTRARRLHYGSLQNDRGSN